MIILSKNINVINNIINVGNINDIIDDVNNIDINDILFIIDALINNTSCTPNMFTISQFTVVTFSNSYIICTLLKELHQLGISDISNNNNGDNVMDIVNIITGIINNTIDYNNNVYKPY